MTDMTRKTKKLVYNTVIVCLLLAGLAYVCARFVHPGVEYTDNAQVCRHITPVNTRVQGFVRKICFDEYQPVSRGDTLLLIEDAEFRLRRAVAGGVARVSGWVDRVGVVPGVGEGAVAGEFMRQMSEAGLKQMYGWALYASVALLLLLLLYDAPVRRGLKLMPLWTRLCREAEG